MFYADSVTSRNIRQLTTSGEELTLYNGITDWLYEGNPHQSLTERFMHLRHRWPTLLFCVYLEEVLLTSSAVWWSPDAEYVAFAEFNDSAVPLYQLKEFGDYNSVYGGLKGVRYPKVSNILHIHTYLHV